MKDMLTTRRGFTLLEVLCVIVIVGTLASIAQPAFLAAIHRAKLTSAGGKLKQVHTGSMLYQADYGGAGSYGSAAIMGLPSEWTINDLYLTVAADKQVWEPTCGVHPDNKKDEVAYQYYPSPFENDQIAKYFAKYRDSSILVADTNCIDHGTSFWKLGKPKPIVGVLLDGSIHRKDAANTHPHSVENWETGFVQ